jgi:ABC-type Fe3+-hydroxamate transport system substrate-binding protein
VVATIVDVLGQIFRPMSPRRIVSLVPSLTETVFAYGLGGLVAGATRYCTEPAGSVAALPRIGGTKDPDLRCIRDLEPDLILASAEENRREDVEALAAEGLTIFVTLPTSVKAALAMLIELAELLGAGIAAEQMTEKLRATIANVEERASGRDRTPYFCPIWRRPYMTSGPGAYAYDLLELSGGRSVCGSGEARYFVVELPDVAACRPAVVLLPDEPYPFADRHKAEFRAFPAPANRPAPAIHCVDGKALTWYGPRSAAALRTFAGLLEGTD